MKNRYHPLVKKTKIELLKLDKLKSISWEVQQEYNSKFLPISVEPKHRKRALDFMDALIKLLEENNHTIQFEYKRCHIEMYGQLTEINLRQKYHRKRVQNDRGYSFQSYEKSDKLEFLVGSCYCKSWIDRKIKKLEDYLQIIYDYIEKDSKGWADLRKNQKLQEEQREIELKREEEKARIIEIENTKLNQLITDSENFIKAKEVRDYLKAFEDECRQSGNLTNDIEEYIKWGLMKANILDPTK
ncbi:hypothetical protein [Tenacibaculum crassostreae]|uniref:hypothetical protein n=1 Tax=Tenacibaculum crassostreae TaxID=502683 RepID=UPI0038B64675